MAFEPDFLASQTIGLPNIVTLTDNSTGDPTGLTNRKVYFQLQDGLFLLPDGATTDYVLWPIANSSITLNILKKDTAANISVDWLDDTLYALVNTNEYLLIDENTKLLF